MIPEEKLCPRVDIQYFSEVSKIGKIIAAGPLTKQRCTKPLREVMIQKPDGSFSVHTEVFKEMPSLAHLKVFPIYTEGEYFGADEIHIAAKRFGERVANKSVFLKSIYLEEPKIIEDDE